MVRIEDTDIAAGWNAWQANCWRRCSPAGPSMMGRMGEELSCALERGLWHDGSVADSGERRPGLRFVIYHQLCVPRSARGGERHGRRHAARGGGRLAGFLYRIRCARQRIAIWTGPGCAALMTNCGNIGAVPPTWVGARGAPVRLDERLDRLGDGDAPLGRSLFDLSTAERLRQRFGPADECCKA